MRPEVAIAGRAVGPDHPPYVICEISGNHNGSLNRALTLVDAAADTGCDAIKLQTYTPDTLTIDADGPGFRIDGGPWDGRTLHDLYGEAHTPYAWHAALFERARARGVTVFSTPFDESAIELLEGLGAPAYKIASFEAVDHALIRAAAATRKPMILSTGIASFEEIGEAVESARSGGCEQLILLHCVSAYPAPVADANVRTVPDLARSFGVVSGLSDHTLGSAASVAAVCLGGAVIEKHFTLARADGGPDAGFSLEPAEFAALVRDCRDAWSALGRVHYDLKGSEAANRQFRRSLYVVRDVPAGEALTAADVRSIRPGFGMAPKHYEQVLGRNAARPLLRGEPLQWDMIA